MKRAYADINKRQLHYRHAGEGDKYILLFHMSGSSSEEYESVGELLAKHGYRVFAPDLPGYGASDAPDVPGMMKEYAKTAEKFMEELGIDSAILYGNMATANLAVHVAVDTPQRVSGLVLAHPLYNHDPELYAKKRELPEFSSVSVKADGSHLAELWRRCAKYGAKPEVADARVRLLHQAGQWGEALHWALFADKGFGRLLPDIRVKTVVTAYEIIGDFSLQKEAAAVIPGGIFELYKNGSPYIARIMPEQVADLIIKYFGGI